ncbi:UPF0721 transmembrane protein [Pilimelia terevasa]|uniref:Probable membrane transporter protein n=1 Tax=Pilimelia terevasa TaxID=53372 RepID=A0A8J3BR81_9ACTN|nr:sulfite exporter TauE/SafE family protein [Pilimelia terevasa]GGK29282.1 UPF0721 transmembrane protein [Pilimelia terevasa]
MIAACGLGALIGVLLGLLGSGGSILAVPALLYGAGMPLSAAIPSSLVVVGASAATGLLPRLRSGLIQWRIAGVVGLVGGLAAFGGAAVNRLLPPTAVLVGFAAVMAAAGVRMLRGGAASGAAGCYRPDGRVRWRSCAPRSAATGAGVGFLTGLFGVGGGFLIVPALVLLLGLSMEMAVATSLVVIALNSAAGFLAHAPTGDLDYPVVGMFTAAAVAGSLGAARFGRRLPADRLRRWFAYLVLLVAAAVATQALLFPHLADH